MKQTDIGALSIAVRTESSDSLEQFAKAWIIRELNFWLSDKELTFEDDVFSVQNIIQDLITCAKHVFVYTKDYEEFLELYNEKFNVWLEHYRYVELRKDGDVLLSTNPVLVEPILGKRSALVDGEYYTTIPEKEKYTCKGCVADGDDKLCTTLRYACVDSDRIWMRVER